ncbi:MAG TPA: hypothetical protein VNO70_00605 [Blastocatellia bacterium]|nr:hypothetical protein [Blastocatellia bacterium]
MSSVRHSLKTLVLLVALTGTSLAQDSNLGKVVFPTTGSEKAQAHFLRGVAALHSFWYEEALEAFRESTRVEPGFAMGYWGEAMAHNHPLWREQATEEARKALEKIKNTDRLTPKERGFIDAVRALYGEGDKHARDLAYAAVMEKLYRAYPDDHEVASFYSLSLLGTVRPGEKGFARQMKAAAIALEVFEENPNHPGAAHYIIHAFDDPEHAILALPAARRYAQIAPDAHHARHMPSHIFLQLGMWPEAASSNEVAWKVSADWVKRKNLHPSKRDYHSLSWLHYIYLQQGRYAKAQDTLAVIKASLAEPSDMRARRVHQDMAATFLVETEQWKQADALLSPGAAKAGAEASSKGTETDAQHVHGPASGMRGGGGRNPRVAFARGLAQAHSGASAEASIAALAAIRKQRQADGDAYEARQVEIMELTVMACAAAKKGNYDEAIQLMKKAVTLEEEMSPPSGPPDWLKPSHETYGEILLAANRPKEAAAQFAISLQRQPNRGRSLLGAARAAAAASGERAGAEAAYSDFLRVWQQADAELPELREARDYLSQAKASR